MTPANALDAAQAAGVVLALDLQGRLVARPSGRLSPDLREAIRSGKDGLKALLRERQARGVPGVDWSRVSLYSLDRILEVAVPWSDARLLIAPGCRIARELRTNDERPGRVWCVCEVLDLLLSGVTPEDARSIAETRIAFDATLTGTTRESGR